MSSMRTSVHEEGRPGSLGPINYILLLRIATLLRLADILRPSVTRVPLSAWAALAAFVLATAIEHRRTRNPGARWVQVAADFALVAFTGLPRQISVFSLLPMWEAGEFLGLKALCAVALALSFISVSRDWSRLLPYLLFVLISAFVTTILTEVIEEQRLRAKRRRAESELLLSMHGARFAESVETFLMDVQAKTRALVDPSARSGFVWRSQAAMAGVPQSTQVGSDVSDAAEAIFRGRARTFRDRSLVCVPIGSNGRPKGVLWVRVSDHVGLSENAVIFVTVIAARIGTLLEEENLRESARLCADIVQSAEELERCSQELLHNITERIGFESAAISLVDEYRGVIEMVRGRNIPRGWMERARASMLGNDILADVARLLRTQTNLGEWEPRLNREIFDKYSHDRLARIWTPIIWQGHCVGVLSAGCSRERHNELITKETQGQLEDLAEKHAESIAKNRPHIALKSLLDEVMRLVGAQGASAHVLEGGTELMRVGSGFVDPDFLGRHRPKAGGLGARCLAERRVLVQSGNELRLSHPDLYGAGVRALAAVPLEVGPNVTGVLYVKHTDLDIVFSPADRRLLGLFALQAQAVIRNGILIRSLARASESAFTAWEQEARPAAALQMTLPRLLDRIRILFEAQAVSLWAIDLGSDSEPRLVDAVGSGEYQTDGGFVLRVMKADEGFLRIDSSAGIVDLGVRLHPYPGAEPNGVLRLFFQGTRSALSPDEQRGLRNLATAVAIRLADGKRHRKQSLLKSWAQTEKIADDCIRALEPISGTFPKRLSAATEPGPLIFLEYRESSLSWRLAFSDGEPLLFDVEAEDFAHRLGDLDGNTRISGLSLDPKTRDILAGLVRLPEDLVTVRPLRDAVGLIGVLVSDEAHAVGSPQSWQTIPVALRARQVTEAFRMQIRTAQCLQVLSANLKPPDDTDYLMESVLTGITAKQGLAFSRAFALLPEGDELAARVIVGEIERWRAVEVWNALETELPRELDDRLMWLLSRVGLRTKISLFALPNSTVSAVYDCYRTGTARIVRASEEDGWRRAVADRLEPTATYPFVVVPIMNGSKAFGVLVADNRFLSTEQEIAKETVPHLEALAAVAAEGIGQEQMRHELVRLAVDEGSLHSQALRFHDRLVRLHRDLAHQLRNPLQLADDELTVALDDPKIPTSIRLRIPASVEDSIRFAKGQLARAYQILVRSRIIAEFDNPDFKISATQRIGMGDLREIFDTAIQDQGYANRLNLNQGFKRSEHFGEAFERSDIFVRGDEELLDQAFRELLRNAQKYGHAGQDVHISSHLGRRKLTVSVTSRGVKLRQADRRHCLTSRWRSREAQGHSADGSGLGLWMVGRIMKGHRGAIVIKSDEEGCSWFALRLPYFERESI